VKLIFPARGRPPALEFDEIAEGKASGVTCSFIGPLPRGGYLMNKWILDGISCSDAVGLAVIPNQNK
jgi:hypothetical protein